MTDHLSARSATVVGLAGAGGRPGTVGGIRDTDHDFGSLAAAAAGLDEHAAELRRRVRQLRAAIGSVGWQSESAMAFRHRGNEVCDGLRDCAVGLEHAAAALHRHAVTARRRLDAIVDLLADAARVIGASGSIGAASTVG